MAPHIFSTREHNLNLETMEIRKGLFYLLLQLIATEQKALLLKIHVDHLYHMCFTFKKNLNVLGSLLQYTM